MNGKPTATIDTKLAQKADDTVKQDGKRFDFEFLGPDLNSTFKAVFYFGGSWSDIRKNSLTSSEYDPNLQPCIKKHTRVSFSSD